MLYIASRSISVSIKTASVWWYTIILPIHILVALDVHSRGNHIQKGTTETSALTHWLRVQTTPTGNLDPWEKTLQYSLYITDFFLHKAPQLYICTCIILS